MRYITTYDPYDLIKIYNRIYKNDLSNKETHVTFFQPSDFQNMINFIKNCYEKNIFIDDVNLLTPKIPQYRISNEIHKNLINIEDKNIYITHQLSRFKV